jgi:flagellin
MSNITLSAGIRANLLSLQGTASLLAQTQNRLATGKKVNSALDNPNSFFTASSLNNRANDLSNILDGISNAVKTIEAADKGIKTLTTLVNTAKSIANQALQAGTNATGTYTSSGAALTSASVITTGGDLTLQNGSGPDVTFTIADGSTLGALTTAINASNSGFHAAFVEVAGVSQWRLTSTTGEDLTVSGTAISAGTIDALTGIAAQAYTASASAGAERAALAVQFASVRTQIDQLITDTSFNGKNLLNGDNLSVVFNEKSGGSQSSLAIEGVVFDSSGLGIAAAAGNWASEGNINSAISNIDSALASLRSQASTFGSSLGIVQARQDFTKELINTLTTGADNLVLADQNEEAANLLALQTRQQLSQTTLSLASQADQSVLRLFA